MKPKLTFLIYFLLAAVSLPAQSLSGTYLVGSSQPVYKKLTDVAAALNNSANTVTGNVVFELDSDYDGTTGETLPVTFNQFNSSGAWTVTIRPKAGVSMRTTAGDPGSNTPVILLNGTDSLVLEGRAGGTGSTIGWTIRNKHTGPNPGAAISLQNDAKKDRLSYLQLEANPTLIDQAVVVLGSTTGPDGNDGNVVSYCNIRNRSDIASPGMYDYPSAGIISVNTTGEASRFNSGNLFEYNNISNFFYPSDSSFGICAYSGTRETTINGNSFYHSAGLYIYPGTFQTAIFIREQSSVSGTIVTNNFIGGSGPRCDGVYGVGYDSYKFAGILFHSHQPLAGQGINQIDGNTIQSFDFSVNAFPDGEVFAGIKVVNSAANVSNNTIGKLTGTQNISLSCGPQPNVTCKAIDYQGLSGSIVNNKIGAFRVDANTIDFTAISFKEAVAGTAVAITGNVVGGATASDGAVTIYGAAVPQKVRGIAITSEGSVNCTGNAISRITVGRPGGTGTLGTTSLVLNGIMKTGTGTAVIKDNTVSELISYCFSPAEDITAPGFAGIAIHQGWTDTVEHNTITGLKRLRPSGYQGSNSGATCMAGIAVSENVYAQIDNNTIEKFESVNEAHPTTLIGIAGGSRFYNNTISLTNRNEAAGTYRENNCGIIGILNNATDMYIFHNSVYVGGNNGEGTNTALSAAVQFSQATSPYVVWNNLFVNERSGGSSAHYGYYYPGEYTSTASEYNLLITAQANKLIRADNADMDSTAWKATGNDPHSTFATTAQIAPADLFTNRFSQLEIAQPSEHYVAGKGDDLPVTRDKKYKARNDLTPSLGAYEYAVLEFTSYGGADSAAVSVAENQTLAATLTAANGNAATITYSITGGGDAAQFSINSATGALSFATAPDFENPGDVDANNVYVVTVQAADGTYTDVQVVSVTVTDVYEAPANITLFKEDFGTPYDPYPGVYDFPAGWIRANVDNLTPAPGIEIMTQAWMAIEDPDNQATNICAWSNSHYQDGNAADDWMWTPAIDLSGSAIRLNWRARRYYSGDPNSNYEVRIMTAAPTGSTGNMGNMLSSTLLSSIADEDYAWTSHTADLSAYSGQRVYIGFRNNSTTGNLLMVDDVEVKTNFAITSTHTDTIFRNTDTMRVAENTTAVGTVAATNEAGGTVSYSITGGADAAQFSINNNTGALAFVTAPDFEAPGDAGANNVYEVTVQATNGTLTDVQAITVTVTDVTDAAVLAITSYSGAASATVNVAENQTLVTTVTATYSDPVSSIAYSLVGSDDDSYFTVDGATGKLSFVNAPDFEHPSDPDENNLYMVTVQASAGSLTATQRFKVRVTNVNDNAPEFGSFAGDAAVTLKIPENTTAVGTVWAVDKEPGTTITYSVLSNNEGALFSINASTGVLRFITAPDYENPRDQYAGNVYIVFVQASDGELTSVQRFKIKVTDVNESMGRMSSHATGIPQTVEEGSTGKGISAFPNPVTGKRFTLRVNDLADGKYILELYTSTGQLAYRQQLNHSGKSMSYPIQLPASLSKGMYVLKLAGAGALHTEKLVIE